VWINGQPQQTVFLYWPAWDWTLSNSHWVDLGEAPDAQYRVKIRAMDGDGEFTEFTNEVTVASEGAEPWSPRTPHSGSGSAEHNGAPRHGTVNHPRSRAAAAIRDNDLSPICAEARLLNTSTTWQEVLPGAERILADYPWNHSLRYLEYRKFFESNTVASTGSPVFRGLDLAGDWPVTELQADAGSHTFSYDYTAYHTNETWSHRWFLTRDGWDPADGLAWPGRTSIPPPSWSRTRAPPGRKKPLTGSSRLSRADKEGPRSCRSGAVTAAPTPRTAATAARAVSSSCPSAT
jgi:hypothetical protein